MLKEIKKVRQIPGEPKRLWFNSAEMDLIVWYEGDVFIGFQFCYDKLTQEKAISWKPSTGLIFENVDAGESRDGHYKATPILIKNGVVDLGKVKSLFLTNADNLNSNIKDFVIQNIETS